jgi:integrase
MTRDKFLHIKTAKGHSYLYFRLPGGKLIRMPDQASPEFDAAYDAAMRLVDTAPKPTAKVIAFQPAASIGAAIDVYLDGLEFRAVKPRTQARYRQACDVIRAELGTGRLRDLTISYLNRHSENMAKEHGTAAADLHVSLFKMIFEACRDRSEFNISDLPNPALNAKRRYEIKRAHRAWSDEAINKFLASAPEHMRLALMLCWVTGQRGSDVVKMRWSDFNGEMIQVRQQKTNGEADAEAHECYCTKQLITLLNTTPRRGEFILTKPDGSRFETANLLGKAFHRELKKAGITESISMHGLRKRAAKDAAEIGGVEYAMAVTGHKNPRVCADYAKGASKRRIAKHLAAVLSEPQVIVGGKAA